MNGLDAARNRLAVLHDHMSKLDGYGPLAADDLHAILSAILDYMPETGGESAPAPLPDPLDESNHADRVDDHGDRWQWCWKCAGFRMGGLMGHSMHNAGWKVNGIDSEYGPVRFAELFDGAGDKWEWCAGCAGYSMYHQAHTTGLGWTAVEVAGAYGPVTVTQPETPPEPVEVSPAEKLAAAIDEAVERYREEDGTGGTIQPLSFMAGMLYAAAIVREAGQ